MKERLRMGLLISGVGGPTTVLIGCTFIPPDTSKETFCVDGVVVGVPQPHTAKPNGATLSIVWRPFEQLPTFWKVARLQVDARVLILADRLPARQRAGAVERHVLEVVCSRRCGARRRGSSPGTSGPS